MFKESLRMAVRMVFSPQEAWKEILEEKKNLYKDFLLPIWSIILLLSFVGGWFFARNGSFELGVKNLIVESFILFGSFHISSFCMNEYVGRLTDVGKNLKNTQKFVAYSSSLIYLIEIVVALFNDFFFIWLFALYTPFIVYVGAEVFYKIIPERRTNFMLLVSTFILIMPLILKTALSMMTKV